MIKQEHLQNGLIKTYSDEEKYIINSAGTKFACAIDSASSNPIYEETDVQIATTKEVQVPSYYKEVEKRLINAVQKYMDSKAEERGYDSILSVCSYINSGVEKFDIEGDLARKWRSACWDYCNDQLDRFKAGERGIPTEEELIDELPKLVW